MKKFIICLALAIVTELRGIARKRGIITLSLYPHLARLLASPCDCPTDHADETLKERIASFDQTVTFLDGFTISPEQARLALLRYFFGSGSLMARRNHIIIVIFGIEQDNKLSLRYRKGWNEGTYKRENEQRLLLAFARHLLETDEVAQLAA
ncbi:hypothetical protein AHiyo6_00220 [Arthrobacter sp. Hiyo6]|nr:hypothetical protein AHiyo6_00220 [Arthrobacter sp. Hiyo6]